ncbi:MAG TPA: sulfatase-like hydrolase/transferase [Thermoanaerobaculia bacterium]|nr:sulfatase-like hydrolase/transferase [Thermoanaerobaculia bacterium]
MRIRFLAASLLAAAAMSAGSCARSQRPNVLIITIDTLRADHLGAYGYGLAHTPNIDRLATQGLLCTDDVASAPLTMPSHTSIFTGLFPPAHGVRDNGAYALGDGAVTLAERLRDAGYTTHAFVSAIVLSRRYNLNQGFETYDDDLWAEDAPPLFMIRERPAPKTGARFLAWFRDWSKTKQKPFFGWVHFFDAHQPYHPTQADLAIAPTAYDAEISAVDREIGKIVDALKADGTLDHTLLIITADHGESLGEHGEKTHGIFVYDATVRVPLIVRYPRLFSPRTYRGPVRSVDITPTVLAVLGLPHGNGMDGRSLLEPFRGKQPPPDLPQYSESLMSELGFGMAPLYAIRDGGYKFIRVPRPELYDLRKDPHELTNLVGSEPRVARRLDAELTRLMGESRQHAVKSGSNPMSRETEESLQALGYLAPSAERQSMQGIDPKDGLPLHNELETARHLAQRARWDDARNVLLDLLGKAPENISALNVLGLIGIKSGNADDALHYYGESLAIDPSQFRVHGLLGTLAIMRGDLQTATREYQASLAINPHYAEAMASLGFIEALQNHPAEAEAWYRKGIAADETFPRVYRRLADLYYERGDFQNAYTNYMQSIRLLPSDLRAILQAGNCARRLGRPQEAESLFRRAERLRPDSWIPTYNRACLYAVTGEASEALQTLVDLAKRHPLSRSLVEKDSDLAPVRKLATYPQLRAHLEEVGSLEDSEDP